MRRPLLWSLAALLATACARLVPAPVGARTLTLAEPAAADVLPRELDVLVWNIRKGKGGQACADEMAEYAADAELVLLQEAQPSPALQAALDTKPSGHALMGVSFRFERRGTSTPTGVATLARAPAQSATVQHSEGREPLARTPKASLVTTYAIAGTDRMLLVVNVHGINFRRAHRLSDQLDALRPLIAAHIGPVIFAGDLNTHHGPRMRVLEQFAADLGLQPVFGPGPDARTRHLRWALDHAYVREIRVVDPIVLDASEGSDHQPLAFRALLDGNPDETPR